MHTSGVSFPVILAFLIMLTKQLATDGLTPYLSIYLTLCRTDKKDLTAAYLWALEELLKSKIRYFPKNNHAST